MKEQPFLSVVIPILNEGATLRGNLVEISQHVCRVTEDYQLILIDDGSSDQSWEIIQDMAKEDSRVSGIKFSRNYGKESAIYAGLERSEGKHVLVMDSDLQHPPAVIPEMVEHYLANHLDVMDGIKRSRGTESLAYRFFARIFYRIFHWACGMDLSRASDFKILSRQATDKLLELREYSLFFRGLSSWIGFEHGHFEFDVDDRKSDHGKWSTRKLFRLGVDAISSYTASPLHIVSFIGVVFLLFAFLLGLQTLYNKLSGVSIDGFTTVILLLLIIGAAIMISLGIMGQYLSRIFDEVKGRPRFIIQDEV